MSGWSTRRLLRWLAFAPALALVFSLLGCSALFQGFLAPVGPIAAAERHELLVVSVILLFVIGPVLLLTPLFAWYYRMSNTRAG